MEEQVCGAAGSALDRGDPLPVPARGRGPQSRPVPAARRTRRSAPGPTSSSATGTASGTRSTCWCSAGAALHLVELKYYSGTLRGDDLPLAARRAPGRGLPAEAGPPQGAAAGEQAPGRAASAGRRRRAPRDPGRPDGRAVRAGVGVPAPPRLPLRCCRRPPGSTCSAWTARRASPGCPGSPSGCWSRPTPAPVRQRATATRSSPR